MSDEKLFNSLQGGHSQGNRAGLERRRVNNKVIPQGKVIPGFLIVRKNGVVYMNPNYKGEDPFNPGK